MSPVVRQTDLGALGRHDSSEVMGEGGGEADLASSFPGRGSSCLTGVRTSGAGCGWTPRQ